MNEILKKDRFKILSYVALILCKNEKILLIRRYKTGIGDGLYGPAGGGIDGDEPITHAMIREAREELGIALQRESLKIVHVLHNKQGQVINETETIGFFIQATEWDGEPQNMEPHKHDDVAWFALNDLPCNIKPSVKHVLDMINKNIFFSEFGWNCDEKE